MTDFDFGFTAVDEDLDEFKRLSAEAAELNDLTLYYADNLQKLRNMIQPLLNNLKNNPDKDYIHWPNRVAKVEEFEEQLNDICGADE